MSGTYIVSEKPLKQQYRLCVAVFVINQKQDLWLGKRIGFEKNKQSWQAPQGGIENGEDVQMAMERELYEEIGVKKTKIIAKSKYWYSYNFPSHITMGKYRGQTQKWFLVQVEKNTKFELVSENHGADTEFSDWKWVAKQQLDEGDWLKNVIIFKQGIYKAVLAEFGLIQT